MLEGLIISICVSVFAILLVYLQGLRINQIKSVLDSKEKLISFESDLRSKWSERAKKLQGERIKLRNGELNLQRCNRELRTSFEIMHDVCDSQVKSIEHMQAEKREFERRLRRLEEDVNLYCKGAAWMWRDYCDKGVLLDNFEDYFNYQVMLYGTTSNTG